VGGPFKSAGILYHMAGGDRRDRNGFNSSLLEFRYLGKLVGHFRRQFGGSFGG
jgi:hypothetical protein